MKKKIYSICKILFFVGFGIFCIVWFLHKMSPEERVQLVDSFRSANYFWVVVAFFLNIFAHVLRALRWQQLIHPMGYRPRFKTTFAAVMIGYMANLAVPRLGEVMRCGVLNRYEKIPMQKSLGTVISERIVDIVVFGCVFLLTLLLEFNVLKDYIYNKLSDKFNLENLSNVLVIAMVCVILLIIILYLLRKRLMQYKLVAKLMVFVKGFWEGIQSVFKLKNPLLFIFYSFAIWAFYFLSLYILFFCFPETASLPVKSALIALVLGSFGVMITPGGIGLYPLLIAESLAIYKLPTSIGYALGWIAWVVQQIGILLIGMASLVSLSLSTHKKHEKPRKDSE